MGNINEHILTNINTYKYIPAWDKGLIRYFGIFHDRGPISNLWFWKPEKILEVEDTRVHPTLGSGFSRYRVMVDSQGVLSRNIHVPCVTSKVTKIPIGLWIGALIFCPSHVVCCIFIYCRVVFVWHCLLSLSFIPRCRS